MTKKLNLIAHCSKNNPFFSQVFIIINPFNTEILLYKPWRPEVFQFESVINISVSSFCSSFEYLYYGSKAIIILIPSVRRSTLDVRIWRLLTSDYDVYGLQILTSSFGITLHLLCVRKVWYYEQGGVHLPAIRCLLWDRCWRLFSRKKPSWLLWGPVKLYLMEYLNGNTYKWRLLNLIYEKVVLLLRIV